MGVLIGIFFVIISYLIFGLGIPTVMQILSEGLSQASKVKCSNNK